MPEAAGGGGVVGQAVGQPHVPMFPPFCGAAAGVVGRFSAAGFTFICHLPPIRWGPPKDSAACTAVCESKLTKPKPRSLLRSTPVTVPKLEKWVWMEASSTSGATPPRKILPGSTCRAPPMFTPAALAAVCMAGIVCIPYVLLAAHPAPAGGMTVWGAHWAHNEGSFGSRFTVAAGAICVAAWAAA